MKNIYKILFILIVCLSFIGNAKAADTYRKIGVNGNNINQYEVCHDSDCKTVSANDPNFSISNNGTATYEGTVYSLGNSNGNTSSTNWSNPCVKLREPLKFIGYIVLIFKIIIPVLLLIFGMMDLIKAVTAAKDGELMKSVKNFAFRLASAVLIFFLPTVINVVFSLVESWAEVEPEYQVCSRCILNVSKC